jgi:hypothetical protein
MSYDIFGNNLQQGCCEVHPWVHETYPCSLCYAENKTSKQQKEYYDDGYNEYCVQMEQEHYESLAKDFSLYFKFICWLDEMLIVLSAKIKEHKKNVMNKVLSKNF